VVKRKSIIFMLMVSFMLVAAVLVAFPKAASANILNASVNWNGSFFQGGDGYYNGREVMAYTENSTATVSFVYLNDMGYDIIAKPFIQFDWGANAGRYYGSEVSMANMQAETLSIQFTVPTAAAVGLVEHGYYISVEYRRDTGRNYNEESVVGEEAYTLSGDPHTYYTLDYYPIVADSLKVWKSTDSGATWQAVASTAYTLTAWTGVIDFGTVSTATDFLFNYSYYEDLGSGDGVNTVFSVYHHPPSYGEVIGTPTVYIADATAKSITATTAFSFDPMSGEVTLTTAPTPDQEVLARYSFYDVIGNRYNSSSSGYTFVVYGTDQAAAAKVYQDEQKLHDLVWQNLPGWDMNGGNLNIDAGNDILVGSATRQAVTAGDAAEAAGQELYANGDFVGAKAQFDIAAAKYQEAIDAQTTMLGGIESGLTGLVTGAGGWLDAQAAKADADAASTTALVSAQKDKLQGEACKAKSYGTFLILLGVGGILVGLGGLLWGVSRVIGARKANQ